MSDRDKLIEAMARGMAIDARAYEGPDLHWRAYVDDAQSALAAIEANGFAVVPREPTEAMKIAAFEAAGPHTEECPLDVWRAMIAAAPNPSTDRIAAEPPPQTPDHRTP
jgi:hypothetical protein